MVKQGGYINFWWMIVLKPKKSMITTIVIIIIVVIIALYKINRTIKINNELEQLQDKSEDYLKRSEESSQNALREADEVMKDENLSDEAKIQ